MITINHIHGRARAQDGFSLLVVLGVMLISGLLLVGALTAAQGDIHLSSSSSSHTQAYYAALAGIQEYDYKLQNNPDYWENCEAPSGEAEGAHFEDVVMPAESAPSGTTECAASNPFNTVIQSKGSLANTFRVEATACSGPAKLTSCKSQPHDVEVRSVIATFQVTGFLNYAYFTQYEDEDYNLIGASAAECEQYYSVRSTERNNKCVEIEFAPEDSVHGPMHTDDAANVCGEVEFGRKGETPADAVEINGGVNLLCRGNPTYNTATGSYTKGKELRAPESDSSLKLYVESKNVLEGATHLVLNGGTNTIEVTNGGSKTTMSWPENGLIYIEKKQKGGVCTYEYRQMSADLANETTEEEGCGTVYVSGTYSKSLTIAAERDVIIAGNLLPTGVTEGHAPAGTNTLGLIATHYVRIYHPVGETYTRKGSQCESHQGYQDKETKSGSGVCLYTNEYDQSSGETRCDAPNASGSLENPWIYAAILSTSHSFLVDNYACGSQTQLGKLNLYGAIAQKFRGIVGQTGSEAHGYIKNYNYDNRLATDEPPYFLAPLKAGWKIIRETAPSQG